MKLQPSPDFTEELNLPLPLLSWVTFVSVHFLSFLVTPPTVGNILSGS